MSTADQESLLPDVTARAVLERLSPGSQLIEVSALSGSYSNSTCKVSGQSATGEPLAVVVRRYAVFGDYDRGEKAAREFSLYQHLRESAVPVPEPLLLDSTGDLLGSPGIVTGFVDGALDMEPADPLAWATAMARTLVAIHRAPYDVPTLRFLLDGNAEATWFFKSAPAIPEYMAAHPQGPAVWTALLRLRDQLQPVAPCLVHIDYWSGQVLWNSGQIVAVIDWEEVAYGDPAIDVAYCLMDFRLAGYPQAGEEFLRVYRQLTNSAPPNLLFWQLAAAVRPMHSPDDWIDQSPNRERFIDLVDDCLRRAAQQP